MWWWRAWWGLRGKGMSGGSLVVGPDGRVLAEAPSLRRRPFSSPWTGSGSPGALRQPLLSDLRAGLPLLLSDLQRVLGRRDADT